MYTLLLVPPVSTTHMCGAHRAAPTDIAIVFEVRTEYYQGLIVIGGAPALQELCQILCRHNLTQPQGIHTFQRQVVFTV